MLDSMSTIKLMKIALNLGLVSSLQHLSTLHQHAADSSSLKTWTRIVVRDEEPSRTLWLLAHQCSTVMSGVPSHHVRHQGTGVAQA